MKKIFITSYFLLIISFSALADESLIQIKQKLESIERNISDLQKVVFSKNKDLVGDNSLKENSNSEITVFDMRLRDIENELKSINLSYENISFEIDDIKKSLEQLSLDLNDVIISFNTQINSKTTNEQDSNIEDNIDSEENNTLGTLKIGGDDLTNIENNNNLEEENSFASPEEQFQKAFDSLRNQKFEIAEKELKKFINDNVNHKLSGSAHYWLGEIYLLRKEYREAALIFAEGYQKYPDSIKSPDSLYKLAETLIKIEKKDEACNTLNQFLIKYPDDKLKDKTELKIKELQCA
tara:strand:+ start:1367 stop:2251 length:885 start_codon:yes stop_codon:yes gene_type:complete